MTTANRLIKTAQKANLKQWRLLLGQFDKLTRTKRLSSNLRDSALRAFHNLAPMPPMTTYKQIQPNA